MQKKNVKYQGARSLNRFLPLLILLILIFIAVGLGARIKNEKNRLLEEKSNAVSQERPPVNVVVQELVPALLRDRLNLPGMVEPWEDLNILAEVSGMVAEVLVEEGEHVNQGDLIVQLDASDYENTRNSIKASYNLALTNLKRLSGLHDQEIIAQSQYDSVKAEVESLEAELAIAELRLKRCYIRSSIAGVVNELPAKKGLYLAVGDPVATVLDIDQVKVSVGIPETDVDAVRKIDRFEVTIEALQNKKITGKKNFLAVAPESQAQVYKLELTVKNQSGEILPGMFARVEIIKDEFPDALAIPLYAVISRDNKHFVFLDEDSVAKLQEVKLGILDGWQVQITDGLASGQRVVVVGQRSVDAGQKLNVVKKVISPSEITR
ncbi:MAG: efflux RND transporter periplasmic adaptor subunit [Deltaproteobacteria bacterium]|jgi:membrane fusion protein (multidrug efflux system)|nr:efflux RND transporter periplasmic adaptor subunit [Deltaproteobacteria bacterium]